MRIVDLSRDLYHRTPSYPGQPPIIHGIWKTHEESFVDPGNVHGNMVVEVRLMETLMIVAIPVALPWLFAWKWGKRGAWGSALVIVLLLLLLPKLQSLHCTGRDCGQGLAFLELTALIIALAAVVSAALAAYASRR